MLTRLIECIGTTKSLAVRRPVPGLTANVEQQTANTIYPPASNLKASIGSTEAARFAGYSAERMEITPSNAMDITAIFQFVSMPLKNGGMGARFTRPQNP